MRRVGSGQATTSCFTAVWESPGQGRVLSLLLNRIHGTRCQVESRSKRQTARLPQLDQVSWTHLSRDVVHVRARTAREAIAAVPFLHREHVTTRRAEEQHFDKKKDLFILIFSKMMSPSVGDQEPIDNMNNEPVGGRNAEQKKEERSFGDYDQEDDDNDNEGKSEVEDYESEEKDEVEDLSHAEFMDIFREGVARLVQHPLLCDLPVEVTLEEINSQIALECGQAMTVRVRRLDGEVLPIVVVQDATVLDLKKAIRRHVQLKLEREGGQRHISWLYVWRTFHLVYEGQKLLDDGTALKEYGIGNRDEVTFLKKLRQR
uniref:Small nuclear ribonucleoprotein 25 n=1 Tax=Eptatretus burgeri TaxID=7764 RepID=A0A8C4Q5B8_EPTBU